MNRAVTYTPADGELLYIILYDIQICLCTWDIMLIGYQDLNYLPIILFDVNNIMNEVSKFHKPKMADTVNFVWTKHRES